jgi:hypothetical protein
MTKNVFSSYIIREAHFAVVPAAFAIISIREYQSSVVGYKIPQLTKIL